MKKSSRFNRKKKNPSWKSKRNSTKTTQLKQKQAKRKERIAARDSSKKKQRGGVKATV